MNYGFFDVLTLLGSLGLFLYGMKVMSDSLVEVAGDKMRSILATMTSNRFYAVFTGFLITAIIQSSSATTLMVISFVNASLLTLTEAIGVILGSHIGTTVTAWLITLLGFKVNLSAMALPLIGLGFLMTFSKKIKIYQWGQFVVGFALLFIGLQFLNESIPNLKDNPEMLNFLSRYTDMGFWSVLLFLGIGTVLTVIIQSSSAAMALTLVMCFQGWLPYDMAAAMVLGQNIGTTITANLGAIVANYHAKRAAMAHTISQSLGVIIMLIFLYPFLHLIDFVSQQNGVSAFDSAEAIPIALSLFHTAFNIANTFILVWFVGLIERIVSKMIKEKTEPEPEVDQPKFIKKSAMRYPQTAVRALLEETKRLFEGPTFEIVAHSLSLHRDDIKSELKLGRMVKESRTPIPVDVDTIYYSKVKSIYSSIIAFATNTQAAFTLQPDRTQSINRIKVANRLIVEVIKDCKALKRNVDQYIDSDNKYIRSEYDAMRKKTSKIFRKIYLTSIDKKPERHLDSLEKLLEKSRKSDVLENGTLDKLIRDKLITSEMATSLANDSANIARISENLIKVAELLYIDSDNIIESLSEMETVPELA